MLLSFSHEVVWDCWVFVFLFDPQANTQLQTTLAVNPGDGSKPVSGAHHTLNTLVYNTLQDDTTQSNNTLAINNMLCVLIHICLKWLHMHKSLCSLKLCIAYFLPLSISLSLSLSLSLSIYIYIYIYISEASPFPSFNLSLFLCFWLDILFIYRDRP